MRRYAIYLIRKIKIILLKLKSNSIVRHRCNIAFNCTFEGKNLINEYCNLYKVELGYGSYIGAYSKIYNCKIGRFCSIATNFKIITGTHPIKKFVSTHPAFFSLEKQAGFTYVKKQMFEEIVYIDREKELLINIGSDVWIGENVSILNGVKIGDGAVIGANSLVLKDIDPYGIYAGVPAKKIGERFTKEQQKFLLEYKWWDKDVKFIEENYHLFEDINMFFEKMRGEKDE